MSFDLKIANNDLNINNDGTLQTVFDNEKLTQDIVKSVLTPIGSNPFHRWIGSTINARIVGQVLDASHTEIEATRALQNTLTNLIALQNEQGKGQYVSPGEQIASILRISVIRNANDPTQWEVTVSVLTRKLTTVEESFTLRT
jgi:hypothetical protein